MLRSSSVSYSRDSDKLPKIEKNPWLTNSSRSSIKSNYLEERRNLPGKYAVNSRDLSNAIKNIDNNYYRRMNKNNPIFYDKLNNIESNYNQMRLMLNDKINRLEHNQRKVNDFLKYSLEQDRLQNDINSYKFNKYLKNYHDKNVSEKEYLLNMLNKVPRLIEKKISKLYTNEIEENRNQKYFLENLKDRMALELQKQRRQDYLKYKRQLNEVIQLKNNEEKEKIKLYHQIQRQKVMIRMQAIKFQNQFYQYQAYNIFPLYQFMQNQSNIINNANKSLELDEIIKMFLFRELMRSMKQKNEFEARNSKYYKPLKKTYKKSSKCSSCFSSSYPGKTFDKNSKKNSNNKASSNKKSTKKTTKSKGSKSGSKSSSSSSSKSSSSSSDKSSDDESKSQKEEKKDDKEDDKKDDKNDENDKKSEESKDDDKSEEKSDKDSKEDDDGEEEKGDEKDDTKNEGTNQNTQNPESYQMPPSSQNPQNSAQS